ncbi:Clathrin heavy chain [Brettanomyces nanus]|uniref:Clathrin heavy chain n=1 Tax=Eeniella nana TaxID=13502 RepID=A0A875RVY7_EENNA|nr:Clathrin heavy chain [Brettanomyces nanus]QPG75907.1 Clathrin heavy chain [Brettanomyces nanus]
MSDNPPIDLIDVCQLQSLGINPASFNFMCTTLQSDHYVCCRETSDTKNTVAIVDLKNNNQLTRKSMSADSVIMNPSDFIIALRANGTTLQVFNLGTKQRLKSNVMHEPVIFWQWLNDKEIGLVSANHIYLWNVLDGTENGPVQLTARHVSLASCQLTQMVSNYDSSWFALCGIAQENNRVVGHIQLYSKERNISQPIEGHVCCFGKFRQQSAAADTQVFACASRTATGGTLHLLEIEHQPNAPAYQKKSVEIFFPSEIANDFPVSIQVSDKYGVVYILTKFGFIHLYDLESGKKIFLNRISSDPIFTAAKFNDGRGLITVNRAGAVLAVEIATDRIVPYILSNLADVDLALSLASRAGLPGAETLFTQQFNQSLATGDYQAAVKIAASSAQLRTPDTINRLKALSAQPGQPAPILQYLVFLLDRGSLNKFESLELVRPLVQQNRADTLEKYLKEDKLTCSEEMGDLVKSSSIPLALAVYYKANSSSKVVNCLAELGQTDKILPFCEKVDFHPNYTALIQSILRVNPDKAAEFSTQLLVSQPDLKIEQIADIFFSQNYIQQGTAFLLDALKDDKPAQGELQTRLLQVNLLNAPQVADAILGNNMFSHYDRPTIAALCEKANLNQRALELYDDTKDIKRVITQHGAEIPADWLVAYFGKLSVEQTIACLRSMLASKNKTQNLQTVIQVATKYSDLVSAPTLIKIFEEYDCTEGLYYYLASIVNTTQDSDVVLKYIQSAAKMGQTKEIERVVRDNNVYNGEKVKNFLKDANLEDQLPLIIVCDRYDYVHDLILYLYKNKYFKFIEVYAQQVNPSKTPQVVAALLDVDCDENIVKTLLLSVVGRVPIGELCDEVEKRNRLKILLPFLEASLQQGVTDGAVYDTLAKIYIDSNNNPEKFLKENDQYNTLVVGKYCEKRDPSLAYIAYEKGQNDAELVQITNENAMYKYQARYVLNRCDAQLWAIVLSDDNQHRRQLIDQIVGTAIPELEDPQPVSIAVKAFMDNGLTNELVELLEKIIIEPSPFNDNPSLQALLILTAIKVDPSRVMGYVEKIDAYDPEEVAPLCIENNLYEEAFAIYDKFEKYPEAMHVLTDDIMSLDRASDYSEKLDKPQIWSQLGAAQLNGLRVSEAIESYLKAQDPSNFEQVIDIAEHAGKEESLVPYLKMARETLQEPVVDGALINAYATLDNLDGMGKFLQLSNVADLETIGDKLYDAANYQAAKLIYSNISNYAKLASTLVYLNDYQGAVDCARKASNVGVWKQVNQACLDNKEFRLAQICGLNLIVHAEELDELVTQYEYNGYFSQLISLFENGLALERAHMGMFTELAILYTKYQPEKTMEHLKLFWSRINMPKVIEACDEAHLWPELVFLYKHYDEWDNAALTMMDHSECAFDHASFKEIIVKVSNLEIYFKAINFYTNFHPSLLNDLLAALVLRLDLPRVVRIFQKSDNLPLIKPFIISILDKNNSIVNQAYHDLLIEEEDYKSLQSVIEAHDKFDQIGLAERLEKHDLIFFRKIAAIIYRKNKKWNKAITLLKTDKLWSEAIETAAMSEQSKVATELLEYFVETGNRECTIATLYSCYSLVNYDKVMELSWLYTLGDLIKPYEISVAKETQTKIAELYSDLKDRESKKEDDEDEESNAPHRLLITNGTGIPTGASLNYNPTGAGFGNGGF